MFKEHPDWEEKWASKEELPFFAEAVVELALVQFEKNQSEELR
jgi:hypothetical protein